MVSHRQSAKTMTHSPVLWLLFWCHFIKQKVSVSYPEISEISKQNGINCSTLMPALKDGTATQGKSTGLVYSLTGYVTLGKIVTFLGPVFWGQGKVVFEGADL